MEDKERELGIVQSHVAQLAEHFDSVQVFATRHLGDGAGTVKISFGSGNWFARYGQVRQWLVQEDSIAKSEANQ